MPAPKIPAYPKERIERAARIYNSNSDAGAALGIAPNSFGRLCRQYGIETPRTRRKKRRAESLKRQPPRQESPVEAVGEKVIFVHPHPHAKTHLALQGQVGVVKKKTDCYRSTQEVRWLVDFGEEALWLRPDALEVLDESWEAE